MLFSDDKQELENQVTDVIYRAFGSLTDRLPMYDVLRTLYYYGSFEAIQTPVPYNMIWEKVNTLASFLYAGYTTNFNVDIEKSTDDTRYLNILKAERAAEAISDRWHDAKIDLIMDLAIAYAIVYSSYFVKLFWRNGQFKPFLVHPGNIGILNEKRTDINAQEAIVHHYTCSVHQFAREIVNHPDREEIVRRVSASTSIDRSSIYPSGIKRIIFAATEQGEDFPGGSIARFPIITAVDRPYTGEEEIERDEIWAWDDEVDDWRIFNVASGNVLVSDNYAGDVKDDDGKIISRGRYVKGCQPFIHICPSPMDDYFFGWPEIFNIVRIQEWHTERLADIRQLFKKALNKPKAIIGTGGMVDERMAARELNAPSGLYTLKGQNLKIEEFDVALPEGIYQELQDIRGLVDDMWGLQDIMKGKGVAGVRSRGQTEILTSYGSSRLKRKALRVEDSCSNVGTLMLKLMQRYDDRHYTLENGMPFILKQIEDEWQVRVDSHSSSPIFSGDQEDKLFALLDRDKIDGQTLIDGLAINFKDMLKRKARQKDKETLQKIANAQKEGAKEAAEEEIQAEKQKLQTVK